MTFVAPLPYDVGNLPTSEVAVKSISARELNQDVSAAKRAAAEEPVVITDRGRPAYVLMSYADYERLAPGAAGQTLWQVVSPAAGVPQEAWDDFSADLDRIVAERQLGLTSGRDELDWSE